MSNKKPQPLMDRQIHQRCPVCGQVSYSVNGIHPQCSARKADSERMERVKIKQQQSATVQSDGTLKPWQKTCPNCKYAIHVRKKQCDCGHNFKATMASIKTYNCSHPISEAAIEADR